MNTSKRSVVIKVGVYSHKGGNHSLVEVVNAICNTFRNAPHIFLTESDNYQGTGTERLHVWQELFSEQVIPFNVSDDTDTQKVTLAGQEMDLSHILFKPNIFVNTHIFRTYERGSILKNLFGCIPDPKKSKFHKDTIFFPLLADMYEAIGGIDLAVLDGTYLWHKGGNLCVPANILVLGKDAVAVETVGAHLAGLKPEKMPVIQEFVKRGLGEGDLEEIDIVGAPFDTLKEKCKSARKNLKEVVARAPAPWSPSQAIDTLIREGFFNLPNRRTRKDAEKALEDHDARARGRSKIIVTTLTRRVKKGVLKGTKGPDDWIYWKD